VKALVTGGAGFIGSHLVDALVAGGHATTVVDNLVRGSRERVPPSAEFLELGVEDDGLGPAIEGGGFDVIFHLAAQIDVRVSMRDPLADARANVLGTVNLLRAASAANVARVVFASSGGAVYGDTDVLPTPEDHRLAPESAYGAAKVSGELYGDMFRRLAGMEFVSLRYGNVYGPRQDPHGEAGVVAIFASRLLRGEDAVINGDGRQVRDYVYVDDVVSANLAAIQPEVSGAFNVGTATGTDVNDLYQLLAGACGSTRRAVHGPPKPGEQRRSILTVDRARSELGWAPSVDLAEGLRRTVDFFRDS
jgi:UDP-glucose 4-epimerase